MLGDRNTGSDDALDAIAALVGAFRPLDRESADLLSAVAHQMRTPLTGIVGFTELLAEGAAGPVTAQQRRLLTLVAQNAAGLMEMVERLEPPHRERAGLEPGRAGYDGSPLDGSRKKTR